MRSRSEIGPFQVEASVFISMLACRPCPGPHPGARFWRENTCFLLQRHRRLVHAAAESLGASSGVTLRQVALPTQSLDDERVTRAVAL